MAKKRWVGLVVAAGLLMTSRFLCAHHSLAIYRGETAITLTGIATEFVFAQPHALIRFDVKDANGNVESWTVETGGPRRLVNAGWDKDTVKPGDQITISGRPAKDGRRMMFLQRLVVNGKAYRGGRRRN